jgi:hypothetical protein
MSSLPATRGLRGARSDTLRSVLRAANEARQAQQGDKWASHQMHHRPLGCRGLQAHRLGEGDRSTHSRKAVQRGLQTTRGCEGRQIIHT